MHEVATWRLPEAFHPARSKCFCKPRNSASVILGRRLVLEGRFAGRDEVFFGEDRRLVVFICGFRLMIGRKMKYTLFGCRYLYLPRENLPSSHRLRLFPC